MTRITIELPDEVTEKLGRRAREAGMSGVDELLASLARAEAEQDDVTDYGGPESVTVRSLADVERLITDRGDDEAGSFEPDAAFYDRLRDRALNGPPRDGSGR